MLHTNDNTSPGAIFRTCAYPPGHGRVSPALVSTLRDMRSELAAQLRRDEVVPYGIATQHVAEIVLIGHVLAIARERDPDEMTDLLAAAVATDWRISDTTGVVDLG